MKERVRVSMKSSISVVQCYMLVRRFGVRIGESNLTVTELNYKDNTRTEKQQARYSVYLVNECKILSKQVRVPS